MHKFLNKITLISNNIARVLKLVKPFDLEITLAFHIPFCHAESVKYWRFFLLFLITFGFLSSIPITHPPAEAKIIEWCKDLYFNNFYCHCQGTKIVCPSVEEPDWNPFTREDNTSCLPYEDKVDCAATNQICTDRRTTDDDDKTAKDAACVVDPNKTATATCTCDHPDDPNPQQNGKKCTIDGKETQTFCATNELCTGAGQCKAMDCTCDKDDEKKVVCSTTGAAGTGKSLTCPAGQICGGNPGQSTCVDKAASEVGKCHCEGNKIKCEKGTMPDCDTNSKCVEDSSTAIGVTCQDTDEALPEPTLKSPPSPPCVHFTDGRCDTVNTAFGNFETDPAVFVSKIFAILLSLSGGVALLLIIRAGYRIMTSRAKPDMIQQGRDELIAAVVGLLFLIFSFVVLQVIGVNILNIPGFGGTDSGGGSLTIAEDGSCDVNNSNCAKGLVCIYTGSGGQCKAKKSEGLDCKIGSDECAEGLSCKFSGSSGTCQK